MGTLWWRYVGLSMRVVDATVIFGGDFNAESFMLLSRLVKVVREIHLVGKVGVKFYLARNNKSTLGDVELGQSEKLAIQDVLDRHENNQMLDKLKIPIDFVLRKEEGEQIETILYNGTQVDAGFEVVDIGE